MSFVNNETFILLFQSGFPLICFSSLIDVAKTSKPMLYGSGESGHPCLVPDFRGNTFKVLPFRIMFAVGLSCMAFLKNCFKNFT